ncbi:MAG: lipoate--protein ligase family protein [Kiritimatiellaceae bacterium]|nr:lipoate--protein ligase family protein [Kiritimatiellaceae bacterium]
MLIIESRSMDVYRNLAIEEYLMDEVQDCGPVLFLWRSECAVVMGKNQNPWRECRLDLMEKEDVSLARRTSGGGTVYHDTGNLNYCVIVGREEYREDQAYELVFQALERFGVCAEKTGKSNLTVGGLKFSGNAFAFRKGRALHHGTLLLNTDLDRLNRYLGSMFESIDTHAIASVPAEVINLDLDVAAVSASLKESFKTVYSDGKPFRCLEEKDLDEPLLNSLLQRQVSNDWTFGATPKFSVEVGGCRMDVAKGVVVSGEKTGQSFRRIAFSLLCLVD